MLFSSSSIAEQRLDANEDHDQKGEVQIFIIQAHLDLKFIAGDCDCAAR